MSSTPSSLGNAEKKGDESDLYICGCALHARHAKQFSTFPTLESVMNLERIAGQCF
jgi:hypothetical protein